jgi:hypothetical protein
MTSYSIDGSVYAYPFQENAMSVEEYNKYYKIIRDLHDIIIEKQPRYIKYFLFSQDINLLAKSIALFDQNIELINRVIKGNPQEAGSIVDLKIIITEIWNRLQSKDNKNDNTQNNERNGNGGDLTEYIIFENWFDIKDVVLKSKLELALPDDINQKIQNEDLKINLKKHLTLIAALNKYIYKNNETHNIIVLNNNISSKTIPITAEFDIKMKQSQKPDKTGKMVNYTYKIKNLPLLDVSIKKQKVSISTLDSLTENKKNNDWEEIYNNAKTNFKDHLVFGPECKEGIKQYIKQIKDKRIEFKSDKLQKIEKWLDEFPCVLYENLKALNDFFTIVNFNKDTKDYCEYYHCKPACESFYPCSSYIRFLGVDCVDERPYHRGKATDFNGKLLDSKEVENIKKSRTKKNNEGNESEYWLHLRPQTRKKHYDPLWFLTLRIHFRLLTAQKIEIGWIGEHLYLPHNSSRYKGIEGNSNKELPPIPTRNYTLLQ